MTRAGRFRIARTGHLWEVWYLGNAGEYHWTTHRDWDGAHREVERALGALARANN